MYTCPDDLVRATVHATPSGLEMILSSKDRGCRNCQLVVDAAETYHPGWTQSNQARKSVATDTNFAGVLKLMEETETKTGTITTEQRMVLGFVRKHSAAHLYQTNKPETDLETMFEKCLVIAPNTAEKPAFDRMREWLSYCVDNDLSCRRRTSNALPRRLLRLGKKDDTTIVLVDTRDLDGKPNGEHIQYACLSYRWGVKKEDILRTTVENVAAHMDETQGIQLHRLPQTIIDTVKVCWELGIEYLWVDSLCIIQPRPHRGLGEDPEAYQDWVKEGSTMDNAYGNSYLTICAETAVNCNAGFLGPQAYGINSWQRIATPKAPSGNAFAVMEWGLLEGLDDAGPNSTVLDGRGWCLQERVIPGRKLRFLGTEMSWECNGRMLCECGHTRGGENIDGIVPVGRLLRHLDHWDDFRHVEVWRELVEDYSWRSVSDPEHNKLMGIAGAASLLLRSSGENDTYLAGLWRSDIFDSFVWMAADVRPNQAELEHRKPGWMAPRHHIRRTRLRNGTPTWSWASVNGGVAFQTSPMWSRKMAGYRISNHNVDVKTPRATIIDAASQLVEHAVPTGNVSHGQVVVDGPLAPVQLAILSAALGGRFAADALHADQHHERPIALARGANGFVSRIVLDVDEMLCRDCGQGSCRRASPWIEGSTADGGCWLEEDSKTIRCWLDGPECTCEQTEDGSRGVGDSCFDPGQGYYALWLHTWIDDKRDFRRMSVRRKTKLDKIRPTAMDPSWPKEMWFLILKLQQDDGENSRSAADKGKKTDSGKIPRIFKRIGVGYYHGYSPLCGEDSWVMEKIIIL